MDQTILFDTYVDECAKVGDIAYDTGEFHTFAQVVDGAYILVELENLYRTSRVAFPIIDEGDVVGYVSRHTWNKDEIDRHNSRVRRKGGYRILRFRNSTENDFVKLLYNYDAVIEGVTDTVIITEGIFDVIALTRKLEIYDNEHVAAVATFGKKISRTQIYKLQCKGVKTVILGYDGDAVEAIKKTAGELNAYFRVFIADIPDAGKDWEDLGIEEIYGIFSYRLRTPAEYRLLKVQELK